MFNISFIELNNNCKEPFKGYYWLINISNNKLIKINADMGCVISKEIIKYYSLFRRNYSNDSKLKLEIYIDEFQKHYNCKR